MENISDDDQILNASTSKCYYCHTSLELDWEFCTECGLEQNSALISKIEHIDFLLAELSSWPERNIANNIFSSQIEKYYKEYRKSILLKLLSTRIEKEAQATLLNKNPSYISKEVPSLHITEPTVHTPISSLPEKTLIEKLSDPETLKWMVYGGASLFVIGTVVYLRELIGKQLHSPIIQAFLFTLLTISTFVSGIFLIKSKKDKLAGKGLTLLGALAVPANLWIVTRAGLLPEIKIWIGSFLCILIYGSTSVILGESFLIYLALPATLLTILSFIKTIFNPIPDVYAWIIILFSLALIKIESKIKNNQIESIEKPFFQIGHVGVAVALVFYSFILPNLPLELIAGLHVIGLGYVGSNISHTTTLSVTLLAAYSYLFTAFTRQISKLTYLGIGLIIIAGFTELHWHNARLTTMVAVFSISALGCLFILQSIRKYFDSTSSQITKIIFDPTKNVIWGIGVISFGLTCLTLFLNWVQAGSAIEFSELRTYDLTTTSITFVILAILFLFSARWNRNNESEQIVGTFLAENNIILAILAGLVAAQVKANVSILILLIVNLLPLLTTPFLAKLVLLNQSNIGSESLTKFGKLQKIVRQTSFLWEGFFFLSVISNNVMLSSKPLYGFLGTLLIGIWILVWERTNNPREIRTECIYGSGIMFEASFILALKALHFSGNLLNGLIILSGYILLGCVVFIEKQAALAQLKSEEYKLPGQYIFAIRNLTYAVLVLLVIPVIDVFLTENYKVCIIIGTEFFLLALPCGYKAKTKLPIIISYLLASVTFLSITKNIIWFTLPNISKSTEMILWTLNGYLLLGTALYIYKIIENHSTSDRDPIQIPQLKTIAQTLLGTSYIVMVVGVLINWFLFNSLDTVVSLEETYKLKLQQWPWIIFEIEVASLFFIASSLFKKEILSRLNATIGMLILTLGYVLAREILFVNTVSGRNWIAIWLIALTVLVELVEIGIRKVNIKQYWKTSVNDAVNTCATLLLLITLLNLYEILIKTKLVTIEDIIFIVLLILWFSWYAIKGKTYWHLIPLGITSIALWVHITIGFGSWNNIEVVSIPLGITLILIGYFTKKQQGETLPIHSFCIWKGSMLALIPIFLHTLQLRFIEANSSLKLDISFDTIAILIIGIGIFSRLGGPFFLGATTLITHLSIVIVDVVQWGQIPYAVYLSVIGAGLFLTGWTLSKKKEYLQSLPKNIHGKLSTWNKFFDHT